MTEALAIVGLVFLIFSVFVFEALLKGREQEGKEVARGVFIAVWALIAFFIGSWALSGFFLQILKLGDWVAKSLHVNVGFLLFLPLVVVFVIGLINNLRKK